jgi:hypothetical protein
VEGGTLPTARVKGICREFIKIYDSSSYREGVSGLRTQGINSVLEEYAQFGTI